MQQVLANEGGDKEPYIFSIWGLWQNLSGMMETHVPSSHQFRCSTFCFSRICSTCLDFSRVLEENQQLYNNESAGFAFRHASYSRNTQGQVPAIADGSSFIPSSTIIAKQT